jgi:chaperonin cofactor prefoldin
VSKAGRSEQFDQLDRLMKEAAKVNQEIDMVSKAREIAEAIGSFSSQRLLARAHDKLEDAWLLIREAQRRVTETA